jgi:L-lactate utilization protein LutC
MNEFTQKVSDERIESVRRSLEGNGFTAVVAESGEKARELVLSLVPRGSEVFTAASVTVDSIGLSAILNGSGDFESVKGKLSAMDQKTQASQMRKLGAAPDVIVGSVHALTETGTLVIASLTGSQLPAYAYGSAKVIYVVGSQKIVTGLEAALKRIDDEVVPLESERARKAYGLPESFRTFPSKILIMNREIQPGRVTVVIVKESLGF